MSGKPLREQKRAFLTAYGLLGNIRAACQAAGVHRTTFYVWTERDPAFAVEAQIAKAEFGDRLEQKCAELALRENNIQAIIVLLKMAGRYVEKVANEHSGPGGLPQRIEVVYTDYPAPYLSAAPTYSPAENQD